MSSTIISPPPFPSLLIKDWEKTRGRTERMPKMVATGTRIGTRPSLFSSGCLWFVSWHPHCSVEWCYNILTISRSRNVNSPLGYLQITYFVSNGRRNKDGWLINFLCWPTSHCFSFSLFLSWFHPHFPPSPSPATSSFLKCGKSYWSFDTNCSPTSASDIVFGENLYILKSFLIRSLLGFCITGQYFVQSSVSLLLSLFRAYSLMDRNSVHFILSLY